MKKFLLLTFVALATIAGRAGTKTFTDQIIVGINTSYTPIQQASIIMEDNGTKDSNGNELYNLALNNFVLTLAGNNMPVGNIKLTDVAGITDANGKLTLRSQQSIDIEAGTLEGVDTWIGPMLQQYGKIPIDMVAYVDGDKIYCSINIDMSKTALQQYITVKLGREYYSDAKAKMSVTSGGVTTTDSVTVNYGKSIVDGSYGVFIPSLKVNNEIIFNYLNFKDLVVTTAANGLKKTDASLKLDSLLFYDASSGVIAVPAEDFHKIPATLKTLSYGDSLLLKLKLDLTGTADLPVSLDVDFGTPCLLPMANVDLGKVHIGESVSKSIAVNALTWNSIAVSSNNTVFALNSNTVQNGSEFTLAYTPTTEGAQTGVVTLSTEGATPLTFNVVANAVQAKITASETALDFGDVDQGYGRTKTLNVTGTDLAEDIAVTVKGSTDFKVSTTTLKEGTTELSILYAPSTKDANKATLVLSSKYAANVEIPLTGNMIVSGIAGVAADNALVNVYTVNGVLVRKDVKAQDALNGLTRGVYVVNGKKILK